MKPGMPNIDHIRRAPRRPGTLEIARAERALVPLARGLAALVGFVDALGFLIFGNVYLASLEASGTILGVALADGSRILPIAATLVFSFLMGVVLTTVCAYRLLHLRRTAILSGVAPCLLVAFLFLEGYSPYISLALLAAAMGALHCIFERDPEHLQEALFPSAQAVRFGEVLGSNRGGEKSGRLGHHGLLWLFFVAGGASGAAAWLGVGGWTVLIASIGAVLLAAYTWLIERNLRAR